jgi:hypothetical protein
MNNSDEHIDKEIAPDVFALASHLYNQKNQDYSLAELKQAGAEVQIPPELIEQAVQQIKQRQIQARERQQKLKLVLISGFTGAALSLGGLWAYNIASNSAYVRQSADLDNGNRMGVPVATPPQSVVPPDVAAQPYSMRFSGKVESYLLNPEGLVDGLMLNNGLQVKFPPHLANSLIATVQLGDSVTVAGNPGIPSNIGQEIHAFTITNTRTQRTVVNQPPPYPPPPPRNNYSNLSVEGTVQHWLVGHRGEINGVILSSGAQVKFPPHVGDQLSNMATRVGDLLQVQGFGTNTSYGKVLAATFVTVNGQPVNFYPERPGLGKRHKNPF